MPPSLLALGLGTMGGLVFTLAGIPLGWMLGSMVFCAVAAAKDLRVSVHKSLRPPSAALVGTMLGTSFTPQMLGQVVHWLWPLVGLFFCLCLATLAGYTFFRRFARVSGQTALLGAMPGGIVEMVMLAEQRGGDVRSIALMHAVRIFVVVAVLPALLVVGQSLPQPAAAADAALLPDLPSLAWLLATGLGGVLLGRLLRLPVHLLLGPMLLGAALHLTGVTDHLLPASLLAVAQVILGSSIGCRFAGISGRETLRLALVAALGTLLMLAVTLAFAWAASRVSGLSELALTLAYAPGGLAEMSLLALALGVDVAFVVTAHILRVLLVILCAPALPRSWIRD